MEEYDNKEKKKENEKKKEEKRKKKEEEKKKKEENKVVFKLMGVLEVYLEESSVLYYLLVLFNMYYELFKKNFRENL